MADGAASAKAEYAFAALSSPFVPLPEAASDWLSFAPSAARSLQFFAEANDGVEPLLDEEEDEEDDDEEEDELPPDEDDDADEVWVPSGGGGSGALLAPAARGRHGQADHCQCDEHARHVPAPLFASGFE